nr:MAG TPA: hypothetical protein [Inoviridae sp.]
MAGKISPREPYIGAQKSGAVLQLAFRACAKISYNCV